MANLHQLVYALSDALDLVGVDDNNHGKRVAYMALECAKALNWRHSDLLEIYHASLLHDCGVSSTRIHDKLVFTLDWDGAEDHCIRGYQLLKLSDKLNHLAPIILYHHTHFDALQQMNVDKEIQMKANLIFLVDRVDALMAQKSVENPQTTKLLIGQAIREELDALRGEFFDPQLLDAFLETSQREVFWFTLQDDHLHKYLNTYMNSLNTEEITLDDFENIAKLFAYLVDAKSPYTADHSLDVAALSKYIASKMGLSYELTKKIEIAGLLHDLGKLRVPDELLDKEGPLSDAEFDVVKVHAYETQQILSQVNGLEDIAEWAAQHHEKLNGKGYPFKNNSGTLSLPARIIAVADIFQALAQKRPYRKNMKPLQILGIIEEKVNDGELDSDVVTIVKNNLQSCWEISITHSKTMM
jgi:putative nucleotidyltransferase with HDIG domain